MRVAGSSRSRQPFTESHSCRWPWLSATPHIFTTPLHSPTASLFSCPLPVIACQINVPLCSQAQKLSRHFQPLLSLSFFPFFFIYIFWFSRPPPPPLWCSLLASIPPLSLSTHGHSCFPSLQFSSSSAVLPQQICLLRPFSADRDNSSFFSPRNLFQPPHLLVCFRPSSH